MSTAYIALGSNQGNPARQLRAAVRAMEQLPESRLGAISRVYRSAAVGPGTQADYLNAVVRLKTPLSPEALLQALQAIELTQGRVRGERWGPRTLDLDILLFDDMEIDTPRLTVPHPAMAQRNFVLYPLREVARINLVLPDGKDLDTLVSCCPKAELMDTGLDLESEATC
jgi:2-amino-4-hydroxy-6-hydroxymethyldihydropteridine diphosphokinase